MYTLFFLGVFSCSFLLFQSPIFCQIFGGIILLHTYGKIFGFPVGSFFHLLFLVFALIQTKFLGVYAVFIWVYTISKLSFL